jgi:hypothetical protein
MLDDDVPNQADIQILVGTVCPEVKVGISVINQMNARRGLVPIEAQVQMRPIDARQDQAGARQKE